MYYDGMHAFMPRQCQAYMFRMNNDSEVWVAFRGSTGAKNVVDNAKCGKMRVVIPLRPDLNNVYFHLGFSELFASVQGIMERDLVTTLAARQSVTDVLFTGHSLGCAVAHVASLYFGSLLRQSFPKTRVSCIGFGGPRCGAGDQLTQAFDECLHDHFQVVNGLDIVPRIPVPGFKHTGRIIWLCEEAESQQGNEQMKEVFSNEMGEESECDVYDTSYKTLGHVMQGLEDHSMGSYAARIDTM